MDFILYAIAILEIAFVVILQNNIFNEPHIVDEPHVSKIVRLDRIREIEYGIIKIDKKYHIQELRPGFFSSFHTYEYTCEGNLDTIHVQCIYDTLEEAEENYKGIIANVEKYGDAKRPCFDSLAPGFGKAPNPFK